MVYSKMGLCDYWYLIAYYPFKLHENVLQIFIGIAARNIVTF